MRTLKFIVDKQIIKLDPNCDFDNLVPGTEEYLRAEFSFSKEWTGYIKVARFLSPLGKEYEPRVISSANTCMIPAEALKRRTFKVQVMGRKEDSKMTTNKVAVSQKGGKV